MKNRKSVEPNSVISPSNGYVLVKALSNDHSSTFLVVETEKSPRFATCIAVGGPTIHTSGDEYLPPCKVGDEIVHSGFGYESIKHKGVDYKLVPFDKVLAVVETEK